MRGTRAIATICEAARPRAGDDRRSPLPRKQGNGRCVRPVSRVHEHLLSPFRFEGSDPAPAAYQPSAGTAEAYRRRRIEHDADVCGARCREDVRPGAAARVLPKTARPGGWHLEREPQPRLAGEV